MRVNSVKDLYSLSVLVLIFFVCSVTVIARTDDDVVVLKNGDRMTGELKSLQQGELRFKADYMAESVRLDWAKVERLESKATFMIWLLDGKIITNVFRLLPANSSDIANFVIGPSKHEFRVPQSDVIRI